ncbi:MAG: TIGR02253 family HAD-type hydrolase [Candidatus Lokiarchaeota archaeon]|nr:TIGR02253 family HAD-type hydrolase [Candidatus Lokiarchaeota archaeon]
MTPIKLIGFDLDDCLFDSTGLSKRARIKGLDAMIQLGLKIDKKKAQQILKEIVKEYGSNFSKHYNILIRRLNLVDENIEYITYNDLYKYVAAAVMAYHQEKVSSIRLYDDVEYNLKRIKDLTIKTAIITDGIPIKQYEKILRLKIDKLIDLVVISDEIGIKKPNPELFNYCLKKFGVKGQEAIYVGDRIDKDIMPANVNKIYSVYLHRGGKYDNYKGEHKLQGDFKPNYEISGMDELFDIINEINNKESLG